MVDWMVGQLVGWLIPWLADNGSWKNGRLKTNLSSGRAGDRLLHRLVAKVFRPHQVLQVDLPKAQRVTWLLLADVACTWGWGYTPQIIP